MILVTGPTGSGKSTTLYALLARHYRPGIKISTVEDPIECQLAGISQVQINTKAGVTFASALRSTLQQDPNVILVGEMRDKETAGIAFQAAMTGRMVLSTLHANSAAAAVSRLFDLGVDASVIANSLSMVVAQRLVRRICDDCKEAYEPDPRRARPPGPRPRPPAAVPRRGLLVVRPHGVLGPRRHLRDLQAVGQHPPPDRRQASETETRSPARQPGMVLLREDALAKVLAGLTSPEEVLRIVQADETEMPCPAAGPSSTPTSPRARIARTASRRRAARAASR